MALWELEELQPPVLLGFIRNLLPQPNFRGNEFLPPQTTDDVEFEYLLGNQPKRAVGERVQGELPPMKRKERISEKEIIRFLQPRQGSGDQRAAVAEVYNMSARLTQSILARVEWLQMQALSMDKVTYAEDGIIIEYDYGVNNLQQIDLLAGTNGAGTSVTADFGPAWLLPDGSPNPDATPVTDLINLSNQVEQRTGRRPTRGVASRKAINSFQFSAQMKGWIYPDNAPDRPLIPGEIDQLFDRYGLPRWSAYDAVVDQEAADGTVSTVRPMAENRAFLLPDQNIGNELWGPTAESRVLLSLNGGRYSELRPGIWGHSYAMDEPPSEWVKVAAVTFPTMPNVHLLSQMKLW
jgi:hypothetical protein